MCGFKTIIHTQPTVGHLQILMGREVSRTKTFAPQSMKWNWTFQRSGFKPEKKTPSSGVVWIFSGETKSCLTWTRPAFYKTRCDFHHDYDLKIHPTNHSKPTHVNYCTSMSLELILLLKNKIYAVITSNINTIINTNYY